MYESDLYQTDVDIREARQRRLAYILFTISMFVSVMICAVLLFLTLAPAQGQRLVGQDSEFAVGEVKDVPVERLELTKLLPTKPNWSEDVIYVIKQPDNSYRAFLGLDPQTGCLINWREDSNQFVDSNCSQTVYSPTGRNQTQAASLAGQPSHMVELAVSVEDGEVYVLDQRMVRDRQ